MVDNNYARALNKKYSQDILTSQINLDFQNSGMIVFMFLCNARQD